ncbi:hypothetical protein F4810DRAFT_406819 [Camillea tinctor]|nr:hypothetical protein F4810DRAFT_406819 [Camillea tinctor]
MGMGEGGVVDFLFDGMFSTTDTRGVIFSFYFLFFLDAGADIFTHKTAWNFHSIINLITISFLFIHDVPFLTLGKLGLGGEKKKKKTCPLSKGKECFKAHLPDRDISISGISTYQCRLGDNGTFVRSQ